MWEDAPGVSMSRSLLKAKLSSLVDKLLSHKSQSFRNSINLNKPLVYMFSHFHLKKVVNFELQQKGT